MKGEAKGAEPAAVVQGPFTVQETTRSAALAPPLRPHGSSQTLGPRTTRAPPQVEALAMDLVTKAVIVKVDQNNGANAVVLPGPGGGLLGGAGEVRPKAAVPTKTKGAGGLHTPKNAPRVRLAAEALGSLSGDLTGSARRVIKCAKPNVEGVMRSLGADFSTAMPGA